MKQVFFTGIIFIGLTACNQTPGSNQGVALAPGQMPNLAIDDSTNINLVYGSNDSIFIMSSTNQGKAFSVPALTGVVPHLTASHTRGPQIAFTKHGWVITACNKEGDIFSFSKTQDGEWTAGARVNDMDTVAKENLMALAADGENAFAVWLDLRNKHNQIFGSRTTDGGKSWSKNIMIYASPDTTVCECCKPAVAMRGNKVYVMFRNWLGGNRDEYLVQSSDGGTSFGQAQKLGEGSWALKGCPMEGGGIAISKSGNPATVWKRKESIYSCEPGKQEKLIAQGKSCVVESVNDKNIYAWVEDGNVIVLEPAGSKLNLGKGQLPVLKLIDDNHAICVWSRDKQIYTSTITL